MSVQVGTQNDVGMQVDYDASTGLLYDVSYARVAHAPVVATSSASLPRAQIMLSLMRLWCQWAMPSHPPRSLTH